MLPLAAPSVVGLNCTTTVMVWDGESVTGALPSVIEYPTPFKLICEIVTLELPVFVIVTLCAADEVPVVTFPKVKFAGLIPRVKVLAIPVPLRLTDVGDVGAFLRMDILPKASPPHAAIKAPLTVLYCPPPTF